MKYQNLVSSPFDLHATIMSLFIVVTYVYAVTLMAITRPIRNRSYLPTTMLICDISSVLTFSLLVLVLLPPIGWFLLFLCAFSFVRVLYSSYQQIFEFLHAFKIQLYSTLKQVWNPSHQASNGNSMEQEGNGSVPMTVWIVKPSTI
jgi:hypothetical protein